MRRGYAFGLTLLLAACGGGGGGAGGSGARTTQQMGTATLTLAFPPSGSSASSASRHVLYVDPATQSVGVSVNGSANQVTNVGASSPNCTTSNSLLTCTVDLSAPYGNDTFAISLYSGQNGTGAVIGTASASGNVSANAPFAISASVLGTYVAYLADGTNGVNLFTESGTLKSTLSFSTGVLDVDDAGNVYNVYPVSTAPGPTSAVQRYPAGSNTPDYTYQPTYPNILLIEVSGAGEVLTVDSGGPSALSYDVWKAGTAGGPPSYSLPAPGGLISYCMEPDGTIVIGGYNGTNVQYNFYPPGSSTPTQTLTESIVPQAQQAQFDPNDITVGSDGTLYVAEFTFGAFGSADALTGLYIYPPSGPERFVATTSDANGGGANGVALDAAGNIYLANNNAILNIPTCSPGPCQYLPDTLHDIEVFSPGATSVLRHITGSWDPYQLSVAPDGTLFFDGSNQSAAALVAGTYYSPANSSTTSLLQAGFAVNIPLYDGVQVVEPTSKRRVASNGSGTKHGGGASLMRFMPALMKERLARLYR